MARLDLTLYAVSDPSARIGVVEAAEAAARGGASLVQLRDKGASDADFAEQARAVMARLRPLGVPLIINDRVDAAKALGCAGVHVGQSDLAARAARAVLGPDAIVGLSIENPAQLEQTPWDAIDYLGAGPIHATATKPDHAPPMGLGGLRMICDRAMAPVVAIGGLKGEDAPLIKSAGAQGMAVVSAIFGSDAPEDAARDILRQWRNA
ncbi:MAG: thiamine phosphate synthase [Neomegalonema sp.]|nr:thiamine phosphate synthase [Neomegalonema sp.]